MQGFRLSPQQRHLWSLSQTSSAYYAQCSLLIENGLQPAILYRALGALVARHEILRTCLHLPASMKVPLQVIAEHGSLAWHVVDLRTCQRKAQEAIIEDLCAAQRRPCHPAHGPVLQATLCRLTADTSLLLLSMPAIYADAQTLRTLVHEISRGYGHCLHSTADTTDVTPYVQFSEWQNILLEESDAETGKAYWQQQQATRETPSTLLPFEKITSGVSAFQYASSVTRIAPRVTADLAALAQAHNVPLALLLLACWQTLLWQLTAREQITVGCLFDGRIYAELESMIGLCARVLPVSLSLHRNARFTEVLHRVQHVVDEMTGWQEYFTWRTAPAEAGQHACCQFEFIDHPPTTVVDGVRFTMQQQSACLEPFRVKLICTSSNGALAATIQYDVERFSPEAIDCLLEEFSTLAASVSQHPETPLGTLNSLSASQRQRLVIELNQTRAEYPHDRCLHQLFEEQAARTPDALALIFQQQALTYGHLNARANQVAYHLRGLGVGPDVCVGVYLQRSPALLVAILGILKAGGAYVPLEMMFPKERLNYVLEDTHPPVLVTDSHLLSQLPEHTARLVQLDRAWEEIARSPAANLMSKPWPASLAYVIYTSGSTGRPKGVMIHQQGLVNYLHWCTGAYAVADGRGAAVHSSLGFDLTVTSFFAPLLVGQAVTLLPEQQSIEELLAVLRHDAHFSLIKITPAHLAMLNQHLPPLEGAAAARVLVIGGSALRGEDLTFWQQNRPGTRLVNEYGPTETVVGCSLYEVPADLRIAGAVPIGRPIANTQLYVLDSQMQPVPVGMAGELYIGGVGVARGYLGRPDLTSAQFVPDPFSAEPGRRVYRTGDIVRYAPDGNLYFLGRFDRQVKLRGFRVELEEIERLLLQHPAVDRAVVVVRENPAGEGTLLAYIVPGAQQQPGIAEVRAFLQERVPSYLVPAAFVTLAALPLTSNGKVDHAQLPAPQEAHLATQAVFVPPRTDIERAITKIWHMVLQVERIGRDDNFFDLGGHSLLLVQVSSLLQEHLQREVTTLEILEYPTIGALARHLSQAGDRERPDDHSRQLVVGRERLRQRKARFSEQ